VNPVGSPWWHDPAHPDIPADAPGANPPVAWSSSFFESRVVASPEFMENVEDLPLQERALWTSRGAEEPEEPEQPRESEVSE